MRPSDLILQRRDVLLVIPSKMKSRHEQAVYNQGVHRVRHGEANDSEKLLLNDAVAWSFDTTADGVVRRELLGGSGS